MAMFARRLLAFHLRPPAHPLAAAIAAPHRRRKHDAVACRAAAGKGTSKARARDKDGSKRQQRRALEEHLKRRTRSGAAFDAGLYRRHSHAEHVPVMLGEVLAAFRRPLPLRSFVDCTLGAAGHSLAVSSSSPSCSPLQFQLPLHCSPKIAARRNAASSSWLFSVIRCVIVDAHQLFDRMPIRLVQ
jgi:hypothetical protein